MLEEINPEYAMQAVADKRLTVDTDFDRGCGVAILWRKSLQITS